MRSNQIDSFPHLAEGGLVLREDKGLGLWPDSAQTPLNTKIPPQRLLGKQRAGRRRALGEEILVGLIDRTFSLGSGENGTWDPLEKGGGGVEGRGEEESKGREGRLRSGAIKYPE
jgi:hypothetical protein